MEVQVGTDVNYTIGMTASREARSENFVSVVVTHKLNLAAEMVDYVVLLQGGTRVRQGKAKEVFQADLLSRAFRTPVLVDKNPSSGCPRVTWVAP